MGDKLSFCNIHAVSCIVVLDAIKVALLIGIDDDRAAAEISAHGTNYIRLQRRHGPAHTSSHTIYKISPQKSNPLSKSSYNSCFIPGGSSGSPPGLSAMYLKGISTLSLALNLMVGNST